MNFNLKNMDRVVVIVDLANISVAMKNAHPDVRLDINKLISSTTRGSNVISKTIYCSIDKENKGGLGFVRFLKINGFNVVTKELKNIRDNNGELILRKANFDVEIAVDVSTHFWKRECDEIILFSGDSDFAYLLDMARRLNFKITIVSSQNTLSRELADRANKLILLEDIDSSQLSRNDSKKLLKAA